MNRGLAAGQAVAAVETVRRCQTHCLMRPQVKKGGAPMKSQEIRRQLLKKSTNPPIKFLAMNKSQPFFRLLAGAAFTLSMVTAGYGSPSSALAIGVAITNGSFQVNHARVSGNATLFDGSTIETATAPSQIQLDGGPRLRLAAETRARIYHNKLVLESGFGQLEAAPGYEVEARTLHITAASPGTVTRIRLAADRNVVVVAAVQGSLRVRNAAGLLVANVPAGASIDFEPQAAGAAEPTSASGCLLQKSGKFLLAEQTTNVILQLEGADLEKQLGNRVAITGIAQKTPATAPGASQLIKVAGVKMLAKGGCTAMAKKLGATATVGAAAASASAGAGGAGAAGAVGAGAAGAATAAGIGAGAMAVVGGVAAAATVGGLAATGSLPGQGDTPSSASR